jgi:hypothetical protein
MMALDHHTQLDPYSDHYATICTNALIDTALHNVDFRESVRYTLNIEDYFLNRLLFRPFLFSCS